MVVPKEVFVFQDPSVANDAIVNVAFQNLPTRGKMVKLFCAIVGVAGNAFSVDIDADQSVGDLREAIKLKKMYKIPADELELFLAKKGEGRGAWLTEEDVTKDVEDITDLKLLKGSVPRLRLVGLSDQDVGGVDPEEEAEGRGPVNVLVVAPGNPILEKLKKQMKDGGSSAQESSYNGLVADLFSWLWRLDKTPSTKRMFSLCVQSPIHKQPSAQCSKLRRDAALKL